ncbi:L,D-transpeptidase catalytic domain [Catalinimonas alkaloidigena]|uniref:L,D-transpeptidase catalytic domain n=1 Tax=Catalinimonas alkaloidigena TaxID=1075417 RepID=A0A1G9EKS8_9BACT|nr:murein L,D-transpeptidase catalytic domain family protein [Catalinimonas alkaloidigena]SDK76651.1 L,D-transpeptidase catalytic domain [Catalinimonas alkaloidigena]
MITRFFNPILLLILSSLALFSSPARATDTDLNDKRQYEFEYRVQQVYTTFGLEGKLNYTAFRQAYIGYLNLAKEGALRPGAPLTVIDFSLPSSQKRLYVIDMVQRRLVLHTYTSHGQGSGADLAKKFSNTPDSHMSSIGFYVTAETYQGKHGYSLRLDGMDKGYNDNARRRAVVMHGADYVSEAFIQKVGRLGRSYGCPAMSWEVYQQVIDKIKGGSCLFIYYNDANYLSQSRYLQLERILATDSETLAITRP